MGHEGGIYRPNVKQICEAIRLKKNAALPNGKAAFLFQHGM